MGSLRQMPSGRGKRLGICGFLWMLALAAILGGARIGAQTAPAAFSQAEALIRSHQWDAGLQLLLPMLTNDADNLRLINLTALAYTGKGEVAEADGYFERALRIDPTFLPALKNLAVNEYNSGKDRDAERHLLLARKQAAADPVINLYLGELAYKRNDFAQVVAFLPQAEPFFVHDANIAAHLLIGYLSVGEAQKAVNMLEQVPASGLHGDTESILGAKLAGSGLFEPALPYLLATRETHADSYDVAYDLIVCYLNLRRYPEALSTAEATMARGQETAELDSLAAEAYEGNHETQKAIDALRRAIALAPDNVDSYLDFASLCIDHQDYAAALKVIQAGMETNPKSDRLFFERAILHAVQDNLQLAEQDFQKAAVLAPEKDSSYRGLGILYLESGKGAEAEQTLKRRLQTKPDDPDLLYLLGEALLKSGARRGEARYVEAQSSLEKSVRLNPGLCLAHVSLGKMYLDQGRLDDAVSELEKARVADPAEKSTYWQLALAYRRLGRPKKQQEVLLSLKKLNDQERMGAKGKTALPEAAAQSSATTPN